MEETEKKLKIAEFYSTLASNARDRFNSRRNVEWKVSIGLWSLFGGAAGVVITARTWVPHDAEVGITFLFIVLVVALYRSLWIPWINEALRRDSAISYFWETAVQTILADAYEGHKDLPAYLLPPLGSTGDPWPRFDDEDPGRIHGIVGNPPRTIQRELHAAQITQIIVTCAFALLLVGALFSKRFSSVGQRSAVGNASHIYDEAGGQTEVPTKLDTP